MKTLGALLLVSVGLLNSPTQSQTSIAASANQICPIKVGSSLPPLKLPTVDGTLFDLNAAISKKPTILIFYRGGWCPFCNRQLSHIRKIHPQFISMGYQVIAVSADRAEKLAETIQKDSLDYTVLSDSKTTAAQALGLAFRVEESTVERYKNNKMDLEEASGERHHLLPVPAVFIVGMDGIINFEYVNPNYRVRIDPEILLAAARSALIVNQTKH